MKARWPLIGTYSATVILVVVVALLKSGVESVRPMEQIRIAVPNYAFSALLFVADEEGFFTSEGLSVELIERPFGKDALALALNGQADYAAAASLPLSAAILDGATLRILATIAKSEHDHVIFANQNRAINHPSDLRGKTIAVPYGTTLEFYLNAVLIDAGVHWADVTARNLAPDAAVEALRNGVVDAVVRLAPLSPQELAELDFPVSVFSPKLYTMHWNIAASDSTLVKHPETSEKLMRALLAAEIFVEDNPERALEITAARTGINQEVLAAHWRDYAFHAHLPQSLIVTLEDETRWANNRRDIHSPSMPSPNFLDYLHSRPLYNVRPDAVRVTQ